MDLQTFGSALAPEISPEEAAKLKPNTLDEPVWTTLGRDLKRIGIKIMHVCFPRGRGPAALRDWDWWGPLVLCFALAIVLSADYKTCPEEAHGVFALVFVVVWIGAIFITWNSSLLGGKVSFFQSVCVLGYCIFPLNLASIFTIFWHNTWYVLLVIIIAWLWATFAALGFLSSMVPQHRRALATYPVFLFYLVIAWMIYFSTQSGKDSPCTSTGSGSK